MKKVLLVYDDFNELTLTESYMKKVGLDVVGISNEVLLSDQILSFNPDAVVAFGQNQKVSSFSVGQKLKQSRIFQGKSIIVAPKGVRPKPDDMIKMRVDALVEAPMPIERLLQVLSKVLGLDLQMLLEKLQRAHQAHDEVRRDGTESGKNSQRGPNPLVSDPVRMAKYAEFLHGEKQIDTQQTSFKRDEVRKKQKDLKKDWDFEELEDLDQLKREFAGALFKKK